MRRVFPLASGGRRAFAWTIFVTAAFAAAEARGDDQNVTLGPEGSAEPVANDDVPVTVVTIRPDLPGGDAASRVSYGRRELELRPRLRPADIVEAVPGLFAVQHAGGGKANQYFLRGFDADHGSDVAFFADGVPINMPSHGHGQGFADLHFVIPELVVGLDGYKGPYYSQFGDFATAGAVNLRFAERFEESFAQYTIGQYGIMRGLVVASPDLGAAWRAVAAAEVHKDDGPFENSERLQRFNVFFRATRDIGSSGKVAMTWMSYGSNWRGSGQIPARAVCGEGERDNPPPEVYGAPCIDRFGFIDPSEGGATQRHSASLAYGTVSRDSELSALAYFISYRFALHSNFTFFAEDPVHGDGIEQGDDRWVFGGDFRMRRHAHVGPAKLTTTLGAQIRHDAIDNSLFRNESRTRIADIVAAHVDESRLGVFAEEDVRLTRHVRLIAALRAERIDVAVEDRLERVEPGATKTSGTRGASLLLPKLGAVLTPIPQLDLFANGGRGFHSNDARGAVLGSDAASLMTPGFGWEVGARVTPVPAVHVTLAAFHLDLDSEQVWEGDAGTTSPSLATRRQGIEAGAHFRLGNWLFADADATFTRARYRETGEAVALAPTRTFTAGIGARPKVGRFFPFASLRLKAIAERPASEDRAFVAEGFTVVDANAGLRFGDVEAGIDVQNLLGTRWREVQYASESRLSYEPVAVTGIHYVPGWPRTVMARAAVYWR